MRDQLGNAVHELLARGGTYADLNLNAVVAEAGIAKTTFYQYFTGKNALLTCFAEKVAAEIGDTFDWLAFDGDPTQQALTDAIRGRLLRTRPYWRLAGAAFEAAYFDPEVDEAVNQLVAALEAGATEHIRRGQQAGRIDPKLVPAPTARWLTWMACRGLHMQAFGADDDRIEPLINGLGATLWSTLYRPVHANLVHW